ncbi:hypothetical protein PIB30_112559, partial [Stylosanthes scabra]|nr:hypothetical protein [Stylosanthes scabra]
APSSYHSQPFHGPSAPLPSGTQSQEPSGGSTRGRRGSTGATAPSHYTGHQTASVRHRRSQASPRRRPSEL